MTENKTDDSFERSINKWSLFFIDEKEEAEYQSVMRKNQRLPPAATYLFYFGIAMHLLYRIIAIISSFMKTGIPFAPIYIEAILLACIVSSIVLEFCLRRYQLLEKIQGLSLYTVLPAVVVTAAFYTQKTPHFGVA